MKAFVYNEHVINLDKVIAIRFVKGDYEVYYIQFTFDTDITGSVPVEDKKDVDNFKMNFKDYLRNFVTEY